jgi:CubicO group peptidase (beta-lactamase class C family)
LPAEVGLSDSLLAALDGRIRAGSFGYVDRMVVVRNGKLVVNERYDNDYVEISRGRTSPIGCGFDACTGDISEDDPFNYLHPDTHPWYEGRDVHSLQSVTKSVTATLIGVATHRGEIESLDTPILSYFGDYDLSGVDPRLHNATLEDLLTMRSGIEWHEQDRPADETNTTVQLERSEDWIQFTLDQPMDAEPGTKWVYNSGGSHLMSGVIRASTGEYVTSYAEEHLFGPLGIRDYHWKTTPTGYPDTEGGLYLEAEQLAKIGLLYLRNGTWDGEQILSPEFADAAVAEHVSDVNQFGWGYGYQWWRLDQEDVEVWAGLGFGEQYLLVLPEFDMVGVINSWNLFGGQHEWLLGAFIDTLISAPRSE